MEFFSGKVICLFLCLSIGKIDVFWNQCWRFSSGKFFEGLLTGRSDDFQTALNGCQARLDVRRVAHVGITTGPVADGCAYNAGHSRGVRRDQFEQCGLRGGNFCGRKGATTV